MEGLYIGLMTGSSADAIDAAMVSFEDGEPRLLHQESSPLSNELRQGIVDLTHGDKT
ncbi:MAG: anhydro-N-acetylmuramic acid kinase, partial [Pseudomonadota bacterium]